MPARNEHLVVIMLEPVNFKVEFEVWPQHITIVPWFPVNDEKKLDEVLQSVAERHKSLAVTVGESELWGRKEKYEVVTIADNDEHLYRLHRDVFNSLETSGFPIHQKDFLGEKYRPHVAVRNQYQKHQPRLTVGRKLTITEFSLISQVRLKKTGRMIKHVKKNYELK